MTIFSYFPLRSSLVESGSLCAPGWNPTGELLTTPELLTRWARRHVAMAAEARRDRKEAALAEDKAKEAHLEYKRRITQVRQKNQSRLIAQVSNCPYL